jgi:phenylpropionate dioxygenase-like ring-hydroxylating dioxygenase large terminal subunit
VTAARMLENVDPALLAAFHPVCRSSEVGEGEVVAVRLLGEDWAVARIDGDLVALPDRCPHRWSPLSAGCVKDGALQCAYHGYRFDRLGRCIEVPAGGVGAPIPPKAHLTPAHAVQERYGLVWLAVRPPLTPIIDVPEWDDPTFTVAPLPDQTWNAGAAQMVDNFLDVAHLSFLHIATFGDPDDIEVPEYEVEREGLGFVCDYVHSAKLLGDSMGADDFQIAPRRSIWYYTAPFSIRLRIEYPAEDVVLTILFFHQPVDASTTKLYCFDLRNDIADGRTTVDETVAFQLAVAEEDRRLLERIRVKATPLELTAEVHTRADRITLEMRRVLRDFVAQSEATSDATSDATSEARR